MPDSFRLADSPNDRDFAVVSAIAIYQQRRCPVGIRGNGQNRAYSLRLKSTSSKASLPLLVN